MSVALPLLCSAKSLSLQRGYQEPAIEQLLTLVTSNIPREQPLGIFRGILAKRDERDSSRTADEIYYFMLSWQF